jgi:hypothetical protein
MSLSLIPLPYKIGAALVLVAAAAAAGLAYRSHVYQQGFDAAVGQRAARDLAAVVNRVQENTALKAQQSLINLTITKEKDEELAPVVKRIYVDRVRVGAGTCGPAATTEANDAAGSDGADSAGRLVREDVERDTRTLDEAVERHLATGRACQKWGAENGFVP